MLCVLIRSNEGILISTQMYHYFREGKKKNPYNIPICLLPGVTINSQWLKLPISRTNVYGPKDCSQRAHDVNITSPQRRYNVMTLHRR